MTSAFDTHTAVESLGAGAYAATVSDAWGIGPVPNGGYTSALALRALMAEAPHPDPLTVTTHFLRPPSPGPAQIHVEVHRAGRSHSTLGAALVQADAACLRLLATFGDLAVLTGPTDVRGGPPQLPPPDDCTPARPDGRNPGADHVGLLDQIDLRFAPGRPGWAHGRPSGDPTVEAWLRLSDGRDPDLLMLALAVDALPPTAFELGIGGWVPTLELTVHLRGRPAPGWLRVRTTTRFLIEGLMEEDAEVWDAEDRLVAQARQLARVNVR